MNDIVTYESKNAPSPDLRWTAYVLLSNGTYWGVRFSDATEAGVISKARELWEKERKRFPYPSHKLQINDGEGEGADKASDNAAHEEPKSSNASPEPSGGRGAHFTGTAWMIHSKTREKVRIPKDQVESYLNKGYERGGPRSK